MKERLRAQLEALRTKLDPFLTKAKDLWSRVGPPLHKKLKWLIYIMILPVLLLVFVVTGFFLVYPAHELRSWVSIKVQDQLNAQQVGIKDMRWDHSPLNMSLGVRLEGVEILRGSWFESLTAQNIRFSISPWGVLVGGTPFDIDVEGLVAEARLSTSSEKQKIEEDANSKSRILAWTKTVLNYVKGYHLNVRNGELRLWSEDKPSDADSERVDFILREMKLGLKLSSYLTQEMELEAVVQTGSPDRWAIAGPIKIQTSSVLQMESSTRPVSLNFNRFEADLSQTSMTGWNVFERIAGHRLHFSAQPKILFKEQKSEVVIANVLFNEARALMDDLEMGLSISHAPNKETTIDWLVGRSEVKEFHLPLRGLRRAPGKGIVSSSGRLVFRDRVDNSEARWRLILNNFRLDSSHLATIWGDKSSVKGELRLSAVSEGELKDGKIESPRTELQVDANDVSWSPPDTNFVKPHGSKAHALLRIKHEQDRLLLEQFDLELHTLKFNITGEARNVLNAVALDENLQLSLNCKSNNVDLSEWTPLFPNFRKVPLQGLFEARAKLSTEVLNPRTELRLKNTIWNVEKFQLSNIRGSVEDASSINISGFHDDVVGPFEASVFFVGRGVGSRVDQARLLGKLDLTDAAVTLYQKFRKPKEVPLLLEISADQSRNRVNIERGGVRFADLDLNFAGSMVQGQGRSRLNVKMAKPINLAQWKDFALEEKVKNSLAGRVVLNGGFSLDSDFQSEKDIDWSTLAFEGDLSLEDLAWSSALLGDFDRLSGRLRFQPEALNFSSFEMSRGPQTYKLDGVFRPLLPNSSKPGPLYLSHFFNNSAWDVRGSIEVPLIEASNLLKKVDSVDRYTFKDSMLDEDSMRWSRGSLNLSIGELLWEQKPFLKSVLGKLDFQDGRWTLRPFSATHGSSKIRGSANLDLTPVWSADQDPQWAASIQSQNLSSNDFPWDLGYEAALMDADLTLTSQGRYFLDWTNNLRVRGLLGVVKAQSSKWLGPLSKKISFFFEESEARDYLLSDAEYEKCKPVLAKTMMELHWIEGSLRLERMRQQHADGGRLDVEALLTPKGQESLVRGKGAFFFGKNCFSAAAKRCFESLGGTRGWPLDFSNEDRAFSELDYSFDVPTYALSFKKCMANQVSERVAQELKK